MSSPPRTPPRRRAPRVPPRRRSEIAEELRSRLHREHTARIAAVEELAPVGLDTATIIAELIPLEEGLNSYRIRPIHIRRETRAERNRLQREHRDRMITTAALAPGGVDVGLNIANLLPLQDGLEYRIPLTRRRQRDDEDAGINAEYIRDIRRRGGKIYKLYNRCL